MRVILVSLPGYSENDGDLFPLGIGYLVGSLKRSHEVKAYHFSKMQEAWNDVRAAITSFRPDLIGLTCSTFNRGNVREMIRFIRSVDNDVKIVVGGVHASFCYDQVLMQYGADVVVIGEGEIALRELCDALENNLPLSSVKGIAFNDKGEIIVSPASNQIRNLDDLPMPDFSFARSFIKASKIGFMITSRGCPVRCSFCSTSSYWGQKTRMYSVSRVIDEMEMMISQFNIQKIFFHDDSFNLGIERVKAICNEIISRNMKIDWACSCRVTPISDEMIALMVKAGCKHICWGIESGSEEILIKINKKITLPQIRNAYELSKKHSSVMSSGAFTMVGNPGETKKTIQDTVRFLNTIPMTDIPSTSATYVLPGTALYIDLIKAGHIKESDWSKYDTVPSYTIENSLLTLARWAKQVNRSALRIPFDPQKHFWFGALETSDLKQRYNRFVLLKKITTVLSKPHGIRSLLNKFLPAGHIRF